MGTVDAYISRLDDTTYQIYVKRAKFKHWFRLGSHPATDVEFERALMNGRVRWNPEIKDSTKIFQKNR